MNHFIMKGLILISLMQLTACAQEATDTTYKRPEKVDGFKVQWEKVGNGVEFCETDAPKASFIGDSRITMLKINPGKVDFDLFCSTQLDKKPRPVNVWADTMDLDIVFNAGMYDMAKPLISRGLLKNKGHVNQKELAPEWNTMFAINPKDSTKKDVSLVDLQFTPYETIKNQYTSFAQGLRMIDGNGNPMDWKKRVQSCSMLVCAQDKAGYFYIFFTRSPYVHNTMIHFLDEYFPTELVNAIYMEGGPETSLYAHIGDFCLQKVGSYVSNTYPTDSNVEFWPLPNVIGIRLKD
ncbi:MAG: hypothetical protein ACK46Y_00150 [Fluviicola sp.]